MIPQQIAERFLERVIERKRGDAPGPTIIVVAGMHGNEPAGVEAIQRVLDRIRTEPCEVRGELIAVRGNVRALAAKRRYLARDLNRLWTPDRVAAARHANADPFTTPTMDGAELSELAELADLFDRAIESARGPVYVLDLHTSSALGFTFAVVGGTPAHHEFALQFPIPGIIGMEELLEGVLTSYLSGKGCITVAIEGGQTDHHETPANLEAVITIGLAAAGVVELPGVADARTHLTRGRGSLPKQIEVTSRHAVTPGKQFRMEPGFANIHRVTVGTLLARDKDGEIRAPADGFVLLPLYQQQGSDGFFFGR